MKPLRWIDRVVSAYSAIWAILYFGGFINKLANAPLLLLPAAGWQAYLISRCLTKNMTRRIPIHLGALVIVVLVIIYLIAKPL